MTGEGAEVLYASVAVPTPVRRLFTYRVGSEARDLLAVGVRVRVPFRTRMLVGTVVEWPAPSPGPEIEMRDIDAVLSTEPVVGPALLALTRFASDYYLCSWVEAIEAATAPARRASSAKPRLPNARAAGTADESLALTLPSVVPGEARLVPTPGQAAALEKILPAVAGDAYAPFLLFGATGSGKTEVYLRAAEVALARGRGVIYLVPEIGLTPLLVSRLSHRFQESLAVLHSGVPRQARARAWDRIRSGEARLVVGARSAVFAPLADPGLIVVDEEQDGSYKQEDAPRYNGRDLAVVRAKEARATLLLGSATPSIESFRNAREGRYELIRLGGRVEDRPLPTVRIVDMRREFREVKGVKPLSRELVAALRECLGRGEQALVLRNRRGWASALHCPSCGERIGCANCSITMTWHRSARRLRCHYCDLERPLPGRCPACGAEGLVAIGEGTERIEEDLKEALPGARIARMDRDTVRRRGAQEALLKEFDRGEIDLLVGTQMIAKGHDFPRVTLVGVLSADQALGLPDFRAAERTFQLLTQVAGRAGRGGSPGRVVVQAFDPGHPVLRAAAGQDYEAFYEKEIGYRRALRYPPFTALVEIIVESSDPARAAAWSGVIAEALVGEGEGRLILSGPGPAPIERLKGNYRSQILLRSSGRRRLVNAVDRALASLDGRVPLKAVRVDVDPVSLL